MERLVLHDDYCRRTLIVHGLLLAVATGVTGFVLNATGFRTQLVLTTLPTLCLVFLGSGVASWIELRARGRLLHHLIETGVRVPATQSDIEWSDDPESSYGTGVWPYTYQGHRYEVRTLESVYVKVRPEATALVDPNRPERAVILMANGITRGGYGLSEGSIVRRIALGSLLLASWSSWVVAIGIAVVSRSS
jgi:hypothetical protein